VHAGKPGEVVLDQLRAVDRSRLLKKLGNTTQKTAEAISEVDATNVTHTGEPTSTV
jgi:mRNA-degrading endonuclease toxin of MazEF toxin-antitoxin module